MSDDPDTFDHDRTWREFANSYNKARVLFMSFAEYMHAREPEDAPELVMFCAVMLRSQAALKRVPVSQLTHGLEMALAAIASAELIQGKPLIEVMPANPWGV